MILDCSEPQRDGQWRIVAANHPELWLSLVKNQDISTGPLTCLFTRLLAPLTYLLTSIVAVNHPSYPNFHPLWFRIVKNQDVSSGPLTCPFACLLTPLIHLFACNVAVNHPGHPHFHPLWFRLVKNQDVSTGPLARPFARSLAPLTRSLAPDCSLCSRPPLRSLICSLARSLRSLPSSWESALFYVSISHCFEPQCKV